MRKFLGILAVVALACSPVLGGISGTVTLTTSGGPWPSSPYIATVQSGSVGIYSAGETFQTFCLEFTETFSNHDLYDASVEPHAIRGGVDGGGPLGSVPVNDGIANQDPVSQETAWLYRQWLANNKMGATAIDFQYAIWYLEDEVSGGLSGTQNALVLAAQSNSQASDLGYVAAMNLYYENKAKQSQLVSVPAPAGAFLVALGLGLVGWVKKRLA